MDKPFEQLVEQERARLQKQRDELVQQQGALTVQIESIDRELHAITVYETARSGKKATKPAGTSGGKRSQVLHLLKDNTAGMSRKDILRALDIKGDKPAEQSVSSALTNLKKQGKITSANDGKWVAT